MRVVFEMAAGGDGFRGYGFGGSGAPGRLGGTGGDDGGPCGDGVRTSAEGAGEPLGRCVVERSSAEICHDLSVTGTLSAAAEDGLVKDEAPPVGDDAVLSPDRSVVGRTPPALRMAIISWSCGVGRGGSITRHVLFVGPKAVAGGFSVADPGRDPDSGEPPTVAADVERSVGGTMPPASRMANISCSCSVNLADGGGRVDGLTGRNDAAAAATAAALSTTQSPEFAADAPTGSRLDVADVDAFIPVSLFSASNGRESAAAVSGFERDVDFAPKVVVDVASSSSDEGLDSIVRL